MALATWCKRCGNKFARYGTHQKICPDCNISFKRSEKLRLMGEIGA